MGNVHVNPGLPPDQRICKPVSFYDLVDLITFSQITFGRSNHMRPGGQRSPALKHISWTLLEDENAMDWTHASTPESTLYLVSSVRALSMSLFPDSGVDIYIEQIRRVVHLPDGLSAPPTGASAPGATQEAMLPILEDDTVSVIVNAPGGGTQVGAQLRLLVDLGTLLAGVIVSPGASIRFVELVSQVVQRTTRAFVTRASDHRRESALASQFLAR